MDIITNRRSSDPVALSGPIFRLAAVTAMVFVIAMAGCIEGHEEPLPDREGLFYPIGMQMHPDGRFLYVLNSNFDMRYRGNLGGTVLVIDTDTGEILSESSPYVPSFGSYLALNDDATKLYVPTRHNNEMTVLSVADQGQALYCDNDGERSADTRPCTVRRIPDMREGTRISDDPFGVAVGRAQRTVGGTQSDFDLVHLSYLRGSDVTSMSLPDSEIAGASMQSAAVVGQGGNQLQMRPGTDEVYVAGRGTNRIEGFRPFLSTTGEVEAIVRSHTVRITESGSGMDARGLAFDEAGDWMYVATRRPNALHMVGMEKADGGGPEVVASIPLENRPSEVHVHRGPDGQQWLYIPSYRYGIVEVVDPRKEAVVDVIDVGRSPYSMTSDSAPANCREAGQRCQGYVTLFDAGTDRDERCDQDARVCGKVAIIDLDPESDTFHTVIETIQ